MSVHVTLTQWSSETWSATVSLYRLSQLLDSEHGVVWTGTFGRMPSTCRNAINIRPNAGSNWYLWLSVTLLKPRSAPALPQTLYDAVEGFAFRLSSMRRVVFGKLSNTWMNIQAIRARTLRSQNRIIDSINLLSCFQIVFSAVRPHFKQNLSKTALIIVKFNRNKEFFLRE